MSKRILLIDSDEAFAQGLSHAIAARGLVATTATNSEQGMTMAKAENPDLIVVCVEAQPTNGYMLCTRLKKDEQLKGIPVILTSANATPDAFEKHKKLKTRAEEYLIKPFETRVMLEKASALMGIRLPPEDGTEEIVSVEDEPLGLGDLVDGEDEPISLSEQETQAALAPEEPVLLEEVEEVVQVEEHPSGDHDLEMFDKAFDSLGGSTPQQPPPKPKAVPAPVSDDTDMIELREITPAAGDGDSLEARVAELEKELLKLREAKNKADKEVLRLKEELDAREEAAKTLQQRADALAAAAKKFERELGAAREESKKSAKSAELEKEVEALNGEKALLAEERDELKKQLEEAQVTAVQNEDRAVKAYQKIKSDEKLREKTRKALEIALQLLSEDPSEVTTEVETAKKSA